MWRVRTASIRAVSDLYYPAATTQCWADIEAPQHFADTFDQIDAIVCVHRSAIVGWGLANLAVCRIDALFVDPNWQGNGFGAAIMRRLEELAVQRHLEKLELLATLNAVAFYERRGFRSLGRIPYHHPNGFSLEGVRMIKRLHDF